jgi:hypothetical protein
LQAFGDNSSDLSFVEIAKENLRSVSFLVQDAMSRVRELAHVVFLGLIKIQMLPSTGSLEEDIRYVKQALDPIKIAMKPLEHLFKKMLLFKDDWFIERVAIAPDIMDLSKAQGLLLQEYYNALYGVVLELTKILWCISFFDEPKKNLKNSKTENALDRSCKITERCFAISQGKSTYLREIDRIFVGDATNESCVWPAAICYSPGIGFLVSLHNSGQVLRLHESGRVIGSIELPCVRENNIGHPHGIAVDDASRIWISIPSENRIEIIDADKNQTQSLEDLVGNPLGLNWPIGIYKTLNGEMLIADTNNSRILAATPSGQIKTIVDHAGKKPGELRHPIAFCGLQKDSQFWVVEIRNHRLQRFNLNGQFLEEIGGLGLGKSHLALPDSAAIFDDGLLAISQWQCSRELKLFSKYGDETLKVDFSPWGILAHKSLLLVCEGFGNHIRIYERI